MRSIFAVITVLLAAAFLYASTIPLIFGVPDYRARLKAAVTPAVWNSGREFDWMVNVLALIPLGFFWSGTSTGHAGRVSSRCTFFRVALGCLILAAFAESLQIWLPLRVPSLRDLVALEMGALVGCGLWSCLGARTAAHCCLLSRRMTSWPPARRWRAGWLSRFAILLGLCMAANMWVTPAECFEMYRQRSFSKEGIRVTVETRLGGKRLGSTFLSSTAAACVMMGICSLAAYRAERRHIRSADGLHIFVEQVESENAEGVASVSIAERRVVRERTERTGAVRGERAA